MPSIPHFIAALYVRFFDRFTRAKMRTWLRSGTTGNTFMVISSGLIGLATGASILLFNWSVEIAGESFLPLFDSAIHGNAWSFALIPLIPAFGGLCVGMLNVFVFRAPLARGITDVILVTRFGRGVIRKRVLLQNLLTASLSIGSGGGGGREGPIVHVGAAVASMISGIMRLSRDQGRTLIACGAAAGISGIFNAPIGGVMFVLEVILGDFRVKTFTPVVVASVVATALTRNAYGDLALVHTPAIGAIALHEYGWFVLLGVLMGVLSASFTRTVIGVEKFLSRYLRLTAVLRPAAGGLAAGLLILFLPALMEQSYEPINGALRSAYPFWMLLAVGFLKPLHASITVGSGGTGGMFAPSLKSGAMFGSAFGTGLLWIFPGFIASPVPFALAGMGAMLAGTMHAPITSVLMVIEISGDYGIVLPAMLTSVLTVLIAQRFLKASIYSGGIETSAGRLGSFAYLPLLNTIEARQIVDRTAPILAPETPVKTILALFEKSESSAFLVADASNHYLGMIEFEELRSFISEVAVLDSIVAADVMISSTSPVREETTLDVVMRLFDSHGWTVLPVVASDDVTPVGVLTSHDVHRFYRISVARET